MNIIVRPVDLESDRKLLIDILSRYLTPLSDDSRFDWLYRKNPHGQARAWLALDSESNTVIGAAAAFPRRLYAGADERLGWVLGDFCINEQHRSLGPALQLQHACLEAANSANIMFCYDFPSRGMMAVYKRLRIDTFGSLLRLARPLRVDHKVRELIKNPVVARGLSFFGNILLGFRNRSFRSNNGISITLHTGKCGEEFSRLAQERGGGAGLCIQHSAEYLNWRYVENPLYHYEFLTACRGETLLAYAVILYDGEDAFLVDLFGVDDHSVLRVLVESAISTLWTRGILTFSVPMVEYHPWLPLLQHLDFKVREASPMVVYSPARFQTGEGLGESQRWCFMHGDRDS